ncbi:MAG: signal peptidase II [candidate division Zixibacteria bacterium 4484_93]|nr:MAG: signal peptidase II [candidate division Zixibacteria bacterium 4484_93]RKZ34799.1 MAG: signal peptidase II [bacterium]
MRKKLVLFLVPIAVLILDQITKALVRNSIPPNVARRVLGDFFSISNVRNKGGAFGTQLGGSYFYIAVSIAAIALIFLYHIKNKRGSSLVDMSLMLILGGALGNLCDRIILGYVTDFLDFGIGELRWPSFNIADSAITVGVILLLLSNIIGKDEKDTAESCT